MSRVELTVTFEDAFSDDLTESVDQVVYSLSQEFDEVCVDRAKASVPGENTQHVYNVGDCA